MSTKDIYVNIHFDMQEGPNFVYSKLSGNRRLIGERYRSYVVQFKSVAAARKAVLAYKKYVQSLGYVHQGQYSECSVYADHGNYTVRQAHMDKLRESFFYLG